MSPSDQPRPWPRVQRALRALNDAELAGLRASLDRSGRVVDPIQVLPDGRIVDGHHRWRLARELDVPCPHLTLNEDEEEAFRMAVELNAQRRQLSPEERREAIRQTIEAAPERTNVDIAHEHQVDPETVRRQRLSISANAETKGRTLRKATDVEKRQAHLLHEEGMRNADIARQLGRPESTVSAWLKQAPPVDDLQHLRHERRLREQKALRSVLDLTEHARRMWEGHAAIVNAIEHEPEPNARIALLNAIRRTQAMLGELADKLDGYLDDSQRERVAAFVRASGFEAS